MRAQKLAEHSLRHGPAPDFVSGPSQCRDTSTRYYLQKVPVESVEPGFSLAIHQDGDYRLFQVECTQMSQRAGKPVMFTLTSGSVDGSDPWVLEYEAGTPVVRILGVCKAAS